MTNRIAEECLSFGRRCSRFSIPSPPKKRKSKNVAGPTPALFSLFASRDRLLLIIFLSVFSFLLL